MKVLFTSILLVTGIITSYAQDVFFSQSDRIILLSPIMLESNHIGVGFLQRF